jgi:hypothetical protein
MTAKPAWVMSPGAVVSSCEEYAYKRWGDYSAYAAAAKRLGRNWRQVYNSATDPSSPVFLNKATIVQTGTSTPTPLQVIDRLTGYHWDDPNAKPGEKVKRFHDIYLPANAFFAMKPTWLAKPGMPVTAAQKQTIDQKIAARWNVPVNAPKAVRVKSDNTPLGIHREAKARFDTAYGNPHDDELADISRRTKSYHDLLAKRTTAMIDLVCTGANDPCFVCSTPPSPPGGRGNQLPGAIQKLKEQIGGDPVINPWDISAVFQPGNAVQRLHSLIALERVGLGLAELENQVGANVPNAALGGAKRKAAPELGQVKAGTSAGGAVRGAGGFTSSNPCLAGLAAKRSALESEIRSTEQTLTRLLVNEISYNDRGCLADAGGNVNICDWSYEMFAAETSTLLDADVEKSFKECRAEVTNAAQAANVGTSGAFTQVLKNPPKQELVFPCVQRRDFTVTAPEAARFIELNGNHLARNCEVWRQNDSIQQQQKAIADDMTGLKWKPTEGEIYDDAVDSLELGSKDSVGAFFNYGSSWKLKKNLPLQNGGDQMSTCRFEGAANSKIAAGIYFFGDELELFKLEGAGSARTENNAPKVTVSASSSYFDMSSFSKKPIFNDQNRSIAGETYAPATPPTINLGGGEVDFWVTIGPIPVHVIFGAVATAGIDYKFAGAPGNNCANMNGPSSFRLVSTIDPFVRADAYADASIDVVVASAGVRLDLLLMRLGIPLGVDVGNVSGGTWRLQNGGRVTIDMLSGKLTGYVEVGAPPLEESWEAEIFGWDGFHTDLATWGLDKTISNNVIRVALAGSVSYNTVKCDCGGGSFCCSMLSCPNNNCPGQKKVNGVNRICSFNAADALAIKNMPGATTENALCSQFVYP